MWRFKLVASVLAGILLASPVMATNSCWLQMAPAGTGTPHCAMMGASPLSDAVSANSSSGSCCEISAADLTPRFMLQSPNDSGARVTPTASSSLLDTPVAVTKPEPTDPLSRAFGSSLQAVFCTFLI